MDKTLRRKYEVPIERLKFECNPKEFSFKTTKELAEKGLESVIIGQEKAKKAIMHGLEMLDPYNHIYAAGPDGTGKNTIIKHQIEEHIKSEKYRPVAEKRDIVSAYNFESPDNPRLLAFKSGEGQKFAKRLKEVVKEVTVKGIKVYANDIETTFTETRAQAGQLYAFYDKKKQDASTEFLRLQTQNKEITNEARLKKEEVAGLVSVLKGKRAQISDLLVQSKDPTQDKKTIEEQIRALKVEVKNLEEDIDKTAIYAQSQLDKAKEKGQEMVDLQKQVQALEEEKNRELDKLDEVGKDQQRKIKKEWIKAWIKPTLGQLTKEYPAQKLDNYLNNMGNHLAKEIGVLMQKEMTKILQKMDPAGQYFLNNQELDLSKYRVKLLYDSSKKEGVPIIIEKEPTFNNLFGRIKNIERLSDNKLDIKDDQHLRLSLDKSGSYLKAHGGYLILDSISVILNGTWWSLQKSMINEKAEIKHLYIPYFGDPIRSEPIENKVKVILRGPTWLYTMLSYNNKGMLKEALKEDPSTPQKLLELIDDYKGDLASLVRNVIGKEEPEKSAAGVYDEHFKKLFKVKAEFDTTTENNKVSRSQYAKFIARFCERKGLKHVTPGGVTEIIEKLVRDTDWKDKISLYVGDAENVIREADKEAYLEGKDAITEKHVRKAIKDERERHDLLEEKIHEYITKGIRIIDTEGELKGQLNALVVYSWDIEFGAPSKVTVSTSTGKSGVISLDMEADSAGKVFKKAVFTLERNLKEIFAQDKTISIDAGVSFEQSYGGIDGDSATLATFIGLMSKLSNMPIDQELAITGSLNQKGLVQPIGGVNAKIEGFYKICQAKGLTGNQGVIVPKINEEEIMLNEEIMDTVKEGKFHIYSVSTPEEAIEIMMGTKACLYDDEDRILFAPGTVYGEANKKIIEYNKNCSKKK